MRKTFLPFPCMLAGACAAFAAPLPNIVVKLGEIAAESRRDLGDAITGARGEGMRECARKP